MRYRVSTSFVVDAANDCAAIREALQALVEVVDRDFPRQGERTTKGEQVGRWIAVGAACVVALAMTLAVSGCGKTDADVAAHNISKAAEQFEVARTIVGINGITDKYLWEVTGYCSVETSSSGLSGALEVTCKLGPDKYKKLFFGLSDNVTYVVQQIDPIKVSTTRYRVIFKPEAIIPDFDRPVGDG